MSGPWRHARARLWALWRRPGSLALVLFAGLMTLAWFPGSAMRGDPWSGVEASPTWMEGTLLMPLSALMGWLLTAWLCGWVVAGRPAVAGSGSWRVALPALPVGPRGRALGEAAVVVGLVLVARLPGFVLGEVAPYWPPLPAPSEEGLPYALVFAPRWLVDGLLLAPLVVAWSAPAMAARGAWPRVIAVAVLMFAARQLGLLASVGTALAVIASLMGLALLGWRAARSDSPRSRRSAWRGPLARVATDPLARWHGDLVWQGLRRSGALRAAAVALVLGGAVVDAVLPLVEDVRTLVFGVSAGLVVGAAFVPVLGSRLALAGVFYPGAHPPGSLQRALSALPLPHRALARGAFVHGAVAGLAAWGLLLLTVTLHTVLTTGAVALRDFDGDAAGWYLLPAGWMTLALGGLAACGLVGDRRGAVIGLASVWLFCVLGVPLLSLFSPGNSDSVFLALTGAFLIPLPFAIAGVWPALRHLRAPRAQIVTPRD